MGGKARDPHQVVTASGVKQHFASTTGGVWNARWHSWRDITPMQAVCNANKACQSDAPPTPKPVEEPEPKCEDFAFDCETCVNKGCTFEPFPKLGGRRELTSIAMPKGMCYKTTKPEFPKVFGRRALTSPISMGGITEPGNCPTTTDPTPSPTADPSPSPTSNPTLSPTSLPTQSPTDVPKSIFCVVRDSTVTGVYTNVEAARIALGKTGGYRRMVCEMMGGKARDPHQVVTASGVKQHFASTTSGVWNARWHSWRDIKPMQAVCNANKACQSDAPPTPKPVEEPEPKCEDFAFDCETCVNKGCTFEPFPKLGGRRELTSIAMPKGMCYKTTKPEFPKVFGRRALTSPISMGGITEPGNCPTTTDP